MNKKLFLSALASTALLASCVENDLGSNEDLSANSYGDGRISFTKKVGNMTRGATNMENGDHFEFGVFNFLGDVTSTSNSTAASSNSNILMPNYLVGYAATSGTHQEYRTWADINKTQTWGPDETVADGTPTVGVDGVSSWVYESMGYGDVAGEATNAFMQTQVLKYWNQAYDNHVFVAYTPYLGHADNTKPMTSLAITPTGSGADAKKANITFNGLASFYTGVEAPTANAKYTDGTGITTYQTENARTLGVKASSTAYASSAASSNTQTLNNNEALYAYNNVERANYGKDVPLNFKHANAKINIAFYEAISGYRVQLIDMFPEGTPQAEKSTNNGASNGNKTWTTDSKTPVTNGIVLTPAIPEYVTQVAQEEKSDSYKGTRYESATVTISGLNAPGADGSIAVSGAETNKNLYFGIKAANGEGHDYATVGNYIEESRSNAVLPANLIPTTLYALPVYQGANIVTAASTANSGKKVAEETGYTLHVSYKIVPNDGTASTTIYDARVYIKPEYCKWEAGKSYTYIFKITDKSNGTTDPNKPDPDGTTTKPYIDPDDPRVPDDPALVPIVFDGVVVTDYDDSATGKVNDIDEWVISDPLSWTNFIDNSIKYYYENNGLINAAYAASISSVYTIVDPNTIGTMTVDAAGTTFTHTTSVSSVAKTYPAITSKSSAEITWSDPKFNLTDNSLTSAQQTAFAVAANHGSASPTGKTFDLPGVVFWTLGTQARTYHADINKIVVSCEETNIMSKDNYYMKSVQTNNGSPVVTYHNKSDDSVVAESDYTNDSGTATPSPAAYSWTYNVVYGTSTSTAAPATYAAGAYMIVKE